MSNTMKFDGVIPINESKIINFCACWEMFYKFVILSLITF